MTKRELRVGILGAGYISRYHADSISHVPGAGLVAVFDLNERAAQRLSLHRSDTEVFTDFERMLDHANLDVVHILTQPDSHYALTKTALESGCNAIV